VRDHGGVLFIDLRDHYGLTQVVADPDSPAFKMAESCAEWVIRVDGKVRKRPEGTENPELPTGQIEVFATRSRCSARRPNCRLPVFGEQDYPRTFASATASSISPRQAPRQHHEARRDHRLDPPPHEGAGLLRVPDADPDGVEPEGARDFLVPSRLHPGKFYALPQAPQQFKQLIMIAGFDRYFQIAPCFRDEDARADRSPGEFYQLDIEMSFVTQEDVFNAVEPVLRGVFEEFADCKP
jgi:aspartyl-tRNA synthetase